MVVGKWELGNGRTKGVETMQSYKELEVYQWAYSQVLEVYALVKRFPEDERYGLSSQLKRAATSIPLNIAEGYGKVETGKEVVRFLSMARGSSAEMEVLLDLTKDLGYITAEEYSKLKSKQESVGRMLTGLIKSLR